MSSILKNSITKFPDEMSGHAVLLGLISNFGVSIILEAIQEISGEFMPKYHHSETGCVFVQDNDGHWFFIPADKLELFQDLKSKSEQDEDAEIEFITDFENYRLLGGPERIVVHSWHYE